MINRAQLRLPDPTRDHIQGDIDAPIGLLEYGDYECPVCGEVQPLSSEKFSANSVTISALPFGISR